MTTNPFSKFVIIMCILISSVVIAGTSDAERKPETVLYTVEEGDSVWTIASNINENYFENHRDTREIVYELRVSNNLDSLMIYPGEKISYVIE